LLRVLEDGFDLLGDEEEGLVELGILIGGAGVLLQGQIR